MRATCIVLAFVVAAVADEPKPVKWDFEDATVDKMPKGWTATKTGEGEGSVWKVVEDKTAPKGPKVLAQTARSPGPLFNLCVADDTSFKDVEVTVAFKAVAGEKDQGGGILWRYQDADNYCVARYNPLENNFRVYKVVGGKRTQLETKEELKEASGEWHTLTIRHIGEVIECSLNGKKHLEARDGTFAKEGKVGLWTKADAQTYFDDFQVRSAK